MKFCISETIKLKTSTGSLELQPGQIVTLPHDAAVKLLNANKITPIGKGTYKIYSKILEDYIWIVATNKELQELVDEGITEIIYTQEEANKLMARKVSREGLKAIHKVKRAFPGSCIEDVSDEN